METGKLPSTPGEHQMAWCSPCIGLQPDGEADRSSSARSPPAPGSAKYNTSSPPPHTHAHAAHTPRGPHSLSPIPACCSVLHLLRGRGQRTGSRQEGEKRCREKNENKLERQGQGSGRFAQVSKHAPRGASPSTAPPTVASATSTLQCGSPSSPRRRPRTPPSGDRRRWQATSLNSKTSANQTKKREGGRKIREQGKEMIQKGEGRGGGLKLGHIPHVGGLRLAHLPQLKQKKVSHFQVMPVTGYHAFPMARVYTTRRRRFGYRRRVYTSRRRAFRFRRRLRDVV